MTTTHLTAIILALLSMTLMTSTDANSADLTLEHAPARICFSPEGGCTKMIISEIETATREILVEAFSFTSSPIRKALLKSQKRGVKVEIIFDRNEQKEQDFRSAGLFAKGGASVYIDDKHSSSHNKVIVIDREKVITGSFNFTYAAEEKNAENVLVIRSAPLAGLYAENWLTHRQHSQTYR